MRYAAFIPSETRRHLPHRTGRRATRELTKMKGTTKVASAIRSTEARNPNTVDIDRWSSARIITALLAEDAGAVEAAIAATSALADAVDRALEQIAQGGRVHYFGAGASGRLSMLDATESAPTFGTTPGLFTAHFPGGEPAIMDSSLDYEDAEAMGYQDAETVRSRDVVVGITASGTTKYVRGALTRAGNIGALTVLVACTEGAPLAALADVTVVADTGPEAIAGSTRLKAGTATKLLLNAFSTTLMVRAGRTYSNLMINLTATNDKLNTRAVQIIEMATSWNSVDSAAALARAGNDLPLALLHSLSDRPVDECRRALLTTGTVRAALETLTSRYAD